VASRAAHPTTVLSDARLPILIERPEETGDGGDGEGEEAGGVVEQRVVLALGEHK
jgi:hypothetical protein